MGKYSWIAAPLLLLAGPRPARHPDPGNWGGIHGDPWTAAKWVGGLLAVVAVYVALAYLLGKYLYDRDNDQRRS